MAGRRTPDSPARRPALPPPDNRMHVLWHAACAQHVLRPNHPECPERVSSILDALRASGFVRRLAFSQADRCATPDELKSVHDFEYVDRILAQCDACAASGETIALASDAVVSPGTGQAALHAAGAVLQAVDMVLDEQTPIPYVFAVVRPPGHHAEPNRAMGFCFFNNVLVAAAYALRRYPDRVMRAAVLDFDVHHGNGSQAIAESRPEIFYASTHQNPIYPFTGKASETGCDGNIVNVELPKRSDSEPFRDAWRTSILPALERFAPDLIFVSAGFDAHVRDPLAQLQLEDDDFAWVSQCIRGVALRLRVPIVSALEGGYSLSALRDAAVAHAGALLGEVVVPDTLQQPDKSADADAAVTAGAATSAQGGTAFTIAF